MLSQLATRIISWRDTAIGRHLPEDRRLDNLDGLRALAVLMVFNQLSGMFPGLVLGPAGIWLFFMISGYLLYRAILLNCTPMPSSRQLSGYITRRALNILPLYLVVLLVMSINFWFSDDSVVTTWFIEHALFVNADYILWPVKLTVIFSLSLPILVIGLSPLRSPRLRFVMILTLAAICWWIFEYRMMIMLYRGSVAYFTPFLVGMALVHLQPAVSPRAGKAAVIAGIVGIILLGADTGWADMYRGWWGFEDLASAWNHGWIFYGPCALLVVGVSAGKLPFWGNPWFRLLGVTSYGIFLWHWIVLGWLGISVPSTRIAALVITIFLSILTHIVIQGPAGLLGERLTRSTSADNRSSRPRVVLVTMVTLSLFLGARQAYKQEPDILIRLEIMPSEDTLTQVFLTDDLYFLDRYSAYSHTEGGNWQILELAIPELRVDRVRLDFADGPVSARLKSFEIKYPRSDRWHELPLDEFRPEQGVASAGLINGEFLVDAEALHTDPIMVYRGDTYQPAVRPWMSTLLLWSGSALIMLLLVCRLLDKASSRFAARISTKGPGHI